MAKQKLGDLPPRYSFILNPYADARLSKCPTCERLTHLRKFVLCIHIDDFGVMGLGETCRYCTPCELIIAHQDELEAELAHGLGRIAPDAIGKKYLVLGTTDKKVWQQGLDRGVEDKVGEFFSHTAQFKKQFDLKITGGWSLPDEPNRPPGVTPPRRS